MTENPIAEILKALQMSELSPEEQEQMLLDINAIIYEGSMVRIVERMDEQTRADFEALMESDADEEAVEAFLKERVPDADALVAETVKELTDDILSGTDTK